VLTNVVISQYGRFKRYTTVIALCEDHLRQAQSMLDDPDEFYYSYTSPYLIRVFKTHPKSAPCHWCRQEDNA